jgi:hypothetical protein
MPFDPTDPWSWFPQPQMAPTMGQQQLKIQPLAPTEEEGLLTQLGSKTLAGLGYAGSVLEKLFGGRAIRGGLYGRPRELLSIIPGSDILGITNPEERVSGKELLGLGHEDDWGSTIAGIGAELALDPATYLTFGTGALTPAGKVAQKAGMLPAGIARRTGTTLADVASANPAKMWSSLLPAAQGQGQNLGALFPEVLGGVFGLRIPFTDIGATFGAGAGGAKFLEGLGTAGKWADWGLSHVPLAGGVYQGAKWLGNQARLMGNALFNPEALDAMTQLGQESAAYRMGLQKPAEAAWRGQLGEWGQALKNAGAGGSGAELRQVIEGVQQGTINPEVLRVGSEIRTKLDATLAQLQALGYDIKPLQDMIQYGPRSFTMPGPKGARAFLSKGEALAPEEMLAREEIFKNIPGGSESINQMALDPRISGPNRTLTTPIAAEAHIRQNYLGVGPAEEAELAQLTRLASLKPLDPALEARRAFLRQQVNNSKGLADWMHQLPESIAETAATADPWRVIGRHPLEDLLSYGAKQSRVMATAEAAHDLIARTAQATAAGPAAAGGEKLFTMEQALQRANLKGGQAAEYLVGRMQELGLPIQDIGELGQWKVPESTVKELGRYIKGTIPSEPTGRLMSWLDAFTNWTKASQTLPFPGFHIRNLISGQWQNVGHAGLEGLDIPGAKSFIAGNVLEGANQIPGLTHLSPEAATQALSREMFAHGGMDYLMNPARELARGKIAEGGLQGSLETFLGRMPGESPRTLTRAGEKLGGDWLPWRSGLDEWAPFAAGREAGDVVEGTNRAALYIQMRQQGYSAEQAGQAVKAAHFEYGPAAKTTFERDVMSRLIPFYCVPDHTRALTRDGWKTCDELQVGDELLTYNTQQDCLEWQPCLEVAVFAYDDDLVVLKNSHHELAFTPNHRWWVKTRAQTVRHPYGTYHYPEQHGFVEGADLAHGHSILCSATLRASESVLTPEQARLLGWLITDGYWRERGQHTEAVLYQHPHKFLAEVLEVAGGRPRQPHPTSGVITVPVVKERLAPLKALLKDREKIIRIVTRLSTAAAQAMYDAMYKADGTVSPHRTSDFLACQKPWKRDVFVVLATMLGKRVTVNKRGAIISRKRYLQVRKELLSRQHYQGRVWCPRTVNGTWIMRQGRLITASGNTYARQNIPYQLGQLAAYPGGLNASLLKTAADLRQQAGFLPQYLGQGLAIPVGGEEGGTRRYLTRTDLPPEQAFELLRGGPHWTQDTLLALLGQSNPMLKGPIEYATGKQFFTGREIPDLYSQTGSALLDSLIMNSPLSRVATTERTLTDPRKWANPLAIPTNLLTGFKLSDVDLEKQRGIAGREFVQQFLRGQPEIGKFEQIYVRPGMENMLSEQEIQLLRLNRTLEQRALQEARARQAQGR